MTEDITARLKSFGHFLEHCYASYDKLLSSIPKGKKAPQEGTPLAMFELQTRFSRNAYGNILTAFYEKFPEAKPAETTPKPQ